MSNTTLKALVAQERLVTAAAVASLELLRSVVSIRVVLIGVLASDVVLIIHMAGILLSLVVSTLAVVSVHAWCQISISALRIRSMALHTLGLGELVNLTTNESHEQLLGESVLHGFAC